MPRTMINASTLKQWLDSGEAVLLDVREPAEYAAEHIAGATLLPLGQVTHHALPDVGGKKLVIHCRKGGRGNSACETILAQQPERELYNLDGGIEAWAAAGYAVERSGSFCLPLDRQVQLTLGLSLLFASLAGHYLTPAFFLLTGFLGAGLTFAGLTGFCGLARLMARMPWNQKGTPCR